MKKRVFISYSHKDETWKNLLVKHLEVLNEHLDVWEDRRIQVGGNWYDEIKGAINNADAAVLLISADFLTSRFILEEEVPKLFKRREKEEMAVFPLIIGHCAWKQLGWLSSIQARPKDGLPLDGKKKHTVDKILSDFAVEIKTILDQKPPRETTAALPATKCPKSLSFSITSPAPPRASNAVPFSRRNRRTSASYRARP